ncbi:MAG: STAS domain-containing protein [Gammaproteobacteria bacterium]|nr:STAS domain-containing protein [Gammaproteobacteria bacterium]
MTVNVKINNGGQIRIEGEMTIYTALELKNNLMPVNHSHETEIDLSGVTEIDTAGLQLLMFIRREARKHKSTLRLTAHSPAVIEVIDVCNLASYFGDPMVM